MEILLEWSSHDGAEAISREGSGQDRDISKGTLEWFVQDIRDFVLEVLGGNQGIDKVAPAPITC